jgi:hypothetical protein
VSVRLTDEQIGALLKERKRLPHDYLGRIRVKPKRGHKERELDVRGDNGSLFRLRVRQANANPLDFSAILMFCPKDTNQTVRLRRYNGRSHEHTNMIEGETFYGFHIHMATERYQELGRDEDSYAELTDRYADLDGALDCLLADCGFDRTNLQTSFFGEETAT